MNLKLKPLLFLVAILSLPTNIAFGFNAESVVKIFVTTNKMDFYRPWQSHGVESSIGSGAIIKGNKILTNAHVVADHTFVQIKKSNDPKRYTAKVLAIGNDCDLALLTVEDEKFFKGTKPLEMGELPKLQDSVVVIGYPTGGDKISITEGVVSRLELTPYSQSSRKLLAVQIDAAINPGNSGGPVVLDGKLVGIAMQHLKSSQNIGYMIPIPIINHFFDDLKDDHYDGFPLIGLEYNNTENNSLRKHYKIDKFTGGVLVTRVLPHSPSENIIEEGDVVLEIDGVKIGEDGTFVFRGTERLSMPHLITKKQKNDKIKIKLVRGGKVLTKKVMLEDYKNFVAYPKFYKKPSYYIYGGLVFTVLSTDLLKSWGNQWWQKAPINFAYHLVGNGHLNFKKKKELVVLLNVLPDDINVGYHGYGNDIVKLINGNEFSSFKEFVEIIEKQKRKEDFVELITDRNIRIILKNKNIDNINDSIIKRNNIPEQSSEDVKKWLNNK